LHRKSLLLLPEQFCSIDVQARSDRGRRNHAEVPYPGPFKCTICTFTECVYSRFSNHCMKHGLHLELHCSVCTKVFPSIYSVACHYSRCAKTHRNPENPEIPSGSNLNDLHSNELAVGNSGMETRSSIKRATVVDSCLMAPLFNMSTVERTDARLVCATIDDRREKITAVSAPLKNGVTCQSSFEALMDSAPVVSNSCEVSEIKEVPPARINMRLRSRKACENIPESPRPPGTPRTAPHSPDGSQSNQGSKEIYVAMLDMAKAFDSVPHGILTRALQRKNIDQDSIDLIINMLTGTTYPEFKELKGTPVRICNGVRQGDPLSPLLFCLFIDELIDQLQASAPSYDFRGSKICVRAFADDLTLLADSAAGLKILLKTTNDFLARSGMRLNAAKCRTLSVCRSPKTKKMLSNPAIKFSLADSTGETSVIPSLRASDTFRFLGHHFDGEGRYTIDMEHIRSMLNMVKSAPLKPEQKVVLIRSHLIPRLQFQFLTAEADGRKASLADSIIRGATKEILRSAKAETAPLNNDGICQPLSEAPDDNAAVVSNSCAVSEIKEMPTARTNMRLRSRKACENIPEPRRLPGTSQTASESPDGSQSSPGSSVPSTSSPRGSNNRPASTNAQGTHVCSVCSRAFNSFPGLRLHEKRAHPATFAASSQKSVKHLWTINHLREGKEVEEMLAANNSRSVKALAEALSRKWSEEISTDMAKYLRKKLRAVDLNSAQSTNTALTDGVNSPREGPENTTEEGESLSNCPPVVGTETMGPERFPECDSFQTDSTNADLSNPCPQHTDDSLSEQGLDRDQGVYSVNTWRMAWPPAIAILKDGIEDRNKHVDAAISVLIEF
ncbi:Retrovirus-related Pol polyprotein from type-1 retrotransposable element, partial [Trichinella britovi]